MGRIWGGVCARALAVAWFAAAKRGFEWSSSAPRLSQLGRLRRMARSSPRLRQLTRHLNKPSRSIAGSATDRSAQSPRCGVESVASHTDVAHSLTPAQRVQVEVDGYVVIPNVLTPVETATLRDALYEMERCWRETGELPESRDPNHYSWLTSNSTDFWRVDNIPHLGECFLDYVTHPRLTAIVKEMVGVNIRLEQSDAHIRRQPSKLPLRPGFHAGPHTSGVGPYGRHSASDWYRFAYVKTLTNLTDLHGPEDGGASLVSNWMLVVSWSLT